MLMMRSWGNTISGEWAKIVVFRWNVNGRFAAGVRAGRYRRTRAWEKEPSDGGELRHVAGAVAATGINLEESLMDIF